MTSKGKRIADEPTSQEPVRRRSWEDFRNTGLLWFVNRVLHLFGWAIVLVCNVEEGTGSQEVTGAKGEPMVTEVLEAYPARVAFRGFHREAEEDGFRKVTRWFHRNVQALVDETEDRV